MLPTLLGSTTAAAADKGKAREETVAFRGTVKNVTSLDDVSFHVLVHPNEEIQRGMKVGDQMALLKLPSDKVVRTAGNTYALAIDPSVLPADYVNDDGLVTVEVTVVNGKTREVGNTMGTARLLRDSRSSAKLWADPRDAQVRNSADPVVNFSAIEEQPGPALLGETALEEPPEDPEDPEDAEDSWDGDFGSDPGEDGACDPAVAASSTECLCTEPPAESMDSGIVTVMTTLVSTSNRWATIGTTYPVGGNTAAMEFSSSATTTYGGGLSYSGTYGSWSASGSKTMSAGWGFKWSNSSANRGYRVQVNYGKYRYTSPCSGYTTYRWTARYETGGTATYTSAVPSWTRCANVSSGTWYRNRSDGYDYTLGTGVKIKDLIGIDLSTKRGYASNHKLIYNVSGTAKKMCGSNNVPSLAGKVQEKYR